MTEGNKPKYYKSENNKYTDKWSKANCHRLSIKYVNWQYTKVESAAASLEMPVASFVRQAVAEKLERMGIDIKNKGENTDND